ncbi:Pex12 amino terminal region-domain-containing protein [Glomus cerebriforme]|uniref:RING-type E3 ubiquitin transferase n=1 Tax=Glomus cerebriforme TaxID=658196 RepID=A0A397T4M2_9GLOM|nr:Pex12 amino terminal region-domain-containing protein [Glomus cerebriforme]
MSNSDSSKENAIPSTSTTAQLSSNQMNKLKRPIPKFNISFPYAAQPDIIRANQKDVYYQQVLGEQVTNVFRTFFGTRIQHQYQKEVNVISDMFYFCLTTLLGTQTLGEEYCDIMQISESTRQFPSAKKRAALIFLHVILPYLYTRGISELRRRTKPRKKQTHNDQSRGPIHNLLPKLQTFLKNHVHAIHLSIFYFYGAYYCLSMRATGIRYIFTRQLGSHEQRLGYEILGFLLVVQFIIQAYLYQKNRIKGIFTWANELIRDESDLTFTSTEGLTPQEIAARKCILCLSPRKNTTATPCGHLFCWTCIVECCNNKPECPLCRQYVNISHLLPIYNY